jgi:hypothetical protein
MLTVDEAERSAMRYWQRTSHVPNVIFRTLSVEAVRSLWQPAWASPFCPTWCIGHGLSEDIASISKRSMTMFTPWTWALLWKSKARLSPAARAFCEFVASPIPDRIRFNSIEDPPLGINNIKAFQDDVMEELCLRTSNDSLWRKAAIPNVGCVVLRDRNDLKLLTGCT